MSKQGMFGLGDNVPSALKYMSAVAIYCESNSKHKQMALIELYKLQRQHSDFSTQIPEEEIGSKDLKLINKQQEQLFGLFPKQGDYRAKYMLVTFEIFRIHQRAQDYRNAYVTLTRLNEKCPRNVEIISRLGRFCLEIGKRVEAESYFQIIQDMIKRQNK